MHIKHISNSKTEAGNLTRKNGFQSHRTTHVRPFEISLTLVGLFIFHLSVLRTWSFYSVAFYCISRSTDG